MRVLTLLLALFCSLTTVRSYAEEPIIPNTECEKEAFGTSRLASDGKNVVVCLIADDGSRYIWKSSTSKASSIPVGAVIAWPALIDPPDMDSWLECKGQAITQNAYPELYAVIGGKVPDYRGLFLRGLGSQTYSQINGSAYGITPTTHSSGQIGQVQGDAIRNITGDSSSKMGGADASGLFTTVSKSGTDVNGNGLNGWPLSRDRFSASVVVPTANENRPVNTAVRYLIRAKS